MLDYRRLDEADLETLRERERRARGLGCWTSIALLLGVPVFALFCFIAWLSTTRGSSAAVVASLILPLYMLLAGIALARAAWRSFIAREFLAGMAQGLAWVAVLLAIAFAAVFILNAVMS